MKNNQSKPITKRNAHGSMKSRMLALFLTLTILLTLLASCAAPAPETPPTPEPTPTPEATTDVTDTVEETPLPSWMERLQNPPSPAPAPEKTPEPTPWVLDYLVDNFGPEEILVAEGKVSVTNITGTYDGKEPDLCERIESDKYVLYIPDGVRYSTHTVPYIDLIMDTVEDVTGVEFKDKVAIWAGIPWNNWLATWGSGIISCDPRYLFECNLLFEHDKDTTTLVFAHEAAHEICYVNFGRASKQYGDALWPIANIEGFACLVDVLVAEKLGIKRLPSVDSSFFRFDLYPILDSQSYFAGYILFQYIYNEHGGMDAVSNFLIEASNFINSSTEPKGYADFVSEYFKINIAEELPKWGENKEGILFDYKSQPSH